MWWIIGIIVVVIIVLLAVTRKKSPRVEESKPEEPEVPGEDKPTE
jgi:hypothetical protein